MTDATMDVRTNDSLEIKMIIYLLLFSLQETRAFIECSDFYRSSYLPSPTTYRININNLIENTHPT